MASLSEKLVHSSLGLEHFFREMAIMYENLAALNKRVKGILTEILDAMAGIMADLLLKGIAIEILDGDCIHSPVLWISAVVAKITNNGKIKLFIVSALGAQSSGKSTLLNTIFGLNFPVSSGRCTRGAYAQLVKMNDTLCHTLKCDYLMVIDSEGLMARTLDDRSKYDNELATFVIALSDLTLVFIKGEGNEMQDVLAIAVHAFMRMYEVGISEQKACRFVHQNMSAVDVKWTSPLEVDTFVKRLDANTLAAAQHTDQSELYTRFTDVIHYDKLRDNTFVPGLTDGTPPMATSNVHYSIKLQELKMAMFFHIKDVLQKKDALTFEEFSISVVQIWRAIKYENFVFNFKNVLAIEAYNTLNKIYLEKKSALKQDIYRSIKNTENKIENVAA